MSYLFFHWYPSIFHWALFLAASLTSYNSVNLDQRESPALILIQYFINSESQLLVREIILRIRLVTSKMDTGHAQDAVHVIYIIAPNPTKTLCVMSKLLNCITVHHGQSSTSLVQFIYRFQLCYCISHLMDRSWGVATRPRISSWDWEECWVLQYKLAITHNTT